MQLEHRFTVPAAVDEAFRVLRDIERIGPCMPGATITSVEGEQFAGKVKVKVGPMQITYEGEARFIAVDEAAHSATIEAKGKEMRGAGTATATIIATCTETDGATDVRVVTNLAVTGKPAEFGQGVMADVGDKLLGRFAACLAEELADTHEEILEDRAPDAASDAAGVDAPGGAEATVAAGAAPPPESTDDTVGQPAVTAGARGPGQPALQRRTADTLDFLGIAGAPILKRVLPLAGGLLVLWAAVRRIRRRR